MLMVSVVAYTAYLVVVLGSVGDGPLAEAPYVSPLLWSVGGAIVAGVVLNIMAGAVVPKGARRKDQRDREINQFGEFVGQSFTVIGGVTAMAMALVEFDYFWIANVIYLGFVLSAILGSIAKIFAYRRGFHPW